LSGIEIPIEGKTDVKKDNKIRKVQSKDEKSRRYGE